MGIKSDVFFRKVDENLHCPICHEVFENPLTCQKGHTFCSKCIEMWLHMCKKCPVDNMPLKKEMLVANLTVKGIIDNMDVYCDPLCAQKTETKPILVKRIKLENSSDDDKYTIPNKTEEECDLEKCCWIGKLHEVQEHRETCGFQQITCPHKNCMQKITRKELEKHKENCKYRRVACEECEVIIAECILQEHKEECPNVMVLCLNECSKDGEVTKIRRVDLDEHLAKECAKTIVSCPFDEQGCQVKIERHHVDDHMQDNMASHMVLLAKQCSLLTKKNQLLQEELTQVKNNLADQVSNAICSYRWKIYDFPTLTMNHDNGCELSSPIFWLCGHKLSLRIYPNGQNEVSKGWLSLYLKLHEEYQNNSRGIPNKERTLHFRLSVLSAKPDADDVSVEFLHVYKKSGGWGCPKFMETTDVLSTAYCNSTNGSLTIQCTIQPDKQQ